MSVLAGRHVLIVEDEYILARQLARGLEREGAIIVASAASVTSALNSLAATARVDVAILDVNLSGEKVYRVADELIRRGTPFVFCSGYDAQDHDLRFVDAPHLSKPLVLPVLIRCLTRLLDENPVG